jgi:hypothetical protein
MMADTKARIPGLAVAEVARRRTEFREIAEFGGAPAGDLVT